MFARICQLFWLHMLFGPCCFVPAKTLSIKATLETVTGFFQVVQKQQKRGRFANSGRDERANVFEAQESQSKPGTQMFDPEACTKKN